MSLLEKYRPQRLNELLGQPWVIHQLELFAANPYPCALLFEGDTGTGKTSAALLLARAIGVNVDEAEFGGLHQIASGEQTGETVRRKMEAMNFCPFTGSGWKVLVVNEADAMTPNAAYVWLDALENLPGRTIVIFTTNAIGRLPRRLRDRCEIMTFESSFLLLRPVLQEMVNRIWREEGRVDEPPEVESLGLPDENGNASFRRLCQVLTPLIRAGTRPAGETAAVSCIETTPISEWGRRWQAGEKITSLAREAGMNWNRLHSELTKLGYKKGA